MSQANVQSTSSSSPSQQQQQSSAAVAVAETTTNNNDNNNNNNLNSSFVGGGSNNGNQYASASASASTSSLYVGDLEANVQEIELDELFKQVGTVQSVRVCRDRISDRSLGYAYVNFATIEEACRALEALNFTPVNGKPIRIMYSHRDPSIRKSGTANIFIKNLDKRIDNKALHETFSVFGKILSCKVASDSSGQSKGYGFVQFEQEEAAQSAIDKLNGMLLNDKQVYVGPFIRKQERDQVNGAVKFCNVYVKNLSESITDEDLKNKFGEYGPITSAVVMRDAEGKSKGFGFVNFENPDDAAKAVENLNGKKFDDKEWYVGRAQKKNEREAELRARFGQLRRERSEKLQGVNLYVKNLDDSIDDEKLRELFFEFRPQKKNEREAELRARFEELRTERIEKLQGVNLYVKNLDDSIDDEKLRELFSEFGTITSCKVIHDLHGQSRGSGFVAFSSPEEANQAVIALNNKIVVSKPIHVAMADQKEERKARMQAQIAVQNPVGMQPDMASSTPLYRPGNPGIGQKMFYRQGPLQLIPPQPSGNGYQQQLVPPGVRPGGPQQPKFYVPLVRQGQRPGARRAEQQHQPQPQFQHQMNPRGSYMVRYPPARNAVEIPLPGVAGGMLPGPFDMGGVPLPAADQPLRAAEQSLPMEVLASALANGTPEQQRMLLGESLYPLVDQLEHDHVAKVTGMLLEMDKTEVLHLLESPEALKAKVAEAKDLLCNVS